METFDEIYQFTDKANYTEEDLKLAREMFDTPEKFQLLRKILQVVTPEERGVSIPSAQALVSAPLTDLHAYAIETAVNHLADEKVRQTLMAFYRLLRQDIVKEAKEAAEEQKRLEAEEKARAEKFQEEKEVEERFVGENI